MSNEQPSAAPPANTTPPATIAPPEFLVCPRTRALLHREGDFLVTPQGVKYPIKDGIPVLLPDAAILPETTVTGS